MVTGDRKSHPIPQLLNTKPPCYFSTQSDGTTNAKSPMGMFPYDIPNDIDLMSKRINEYYQGY